MGGIIMNSFGTQFVCGGMIVLIGSIAFLKFFDFLARQSIKRLLEAAGRKPAN
jgi:hypothetical protein